jgi:hypothetical protein
MTQATYVHLFCLNLFANPHSPTAADPDRPPADPDRVGLGLACGRVGVYSSPPKVQRIHSVSGGV